MICSISQYEFLVVVQSKILREEGLEVMCVELQNWLKLIYLKR